MGWECFCVVGFDREPLLQGRTRILHLQYFFKYVLTYSLHLTVTLLLSFIIPFAGHNFLSFSSVRFRISFELLLNYFCTALSLIIMLSSHYYLHKSKTLSQLTQCPFTGTLLLLDNLLSHQIENTVKLYPYRLIPQLLQLY